MRGPAQGRDSGLGLTAPDCLPLLPGRTHLNVGAHFGPEVPFLFLTITQYIGISTAVTGQEMFVNDHILPLRRPDEKTADPGTLRLGDCLVSATSPALRRPEQNTTDTGRLRLGDCLISAQFARL